MDLGSEFSLNAEAAGPSFGPDGRSTYPSVQSDVATVAKSMQQLIDDLPEEIALLDDTGTIIAINHAWQHTIEEHGRMEASPGRNYRDVCAKRAADGYEPAKEALSALDDICSGTRTFWQLVYNGGQLWNGRDYQISFNRIGVGDRTIISVTRVDLTEIFELRRAKTDFAQSLIQSQAVERQRMARELHDSTSQLLTGAGLLLARLKHEAIGDRPLALVDELQTLVREAQQEIRLVSYLACPPALEKMCLVDALKALVEGFGRRTRLQISFDVRGENVSVVAAGSALYRVAQEALSNIHRHARATRVRVMLCSRRTATYLVVADNGIGIPRRMITDSAGAGVGLASMRSRLTEMGGRLRIRSLAPGTAIVAGIPKEG
jgi:two-component system, NarL family, sensor kinase